MMWSLAVATSQEPLAASWSCKKLENRFFSGASRRNAALLVCGHLDVNTHLVAKLLALPLHTFSYLLLADSMASPSLGQPLLYLPLYNVSRISPGNKHVTHIRQAELFPVGIQITGGGTGSCPPVSLSAKRYQVRYLKVYLQKEQKRPAGMKGKLQA